MSRAQLLPTVIAPINSGTHTDDRWC